MMTPNDRVTVSVNVRATPEDAFHIFTTETDLWWHRGFKYRMAGRNPGVIRFEPPALGGKLIETFDPPAGDPPKTYETGTITAWDPPALLRFEWRAVNFKPAETTTVEVTFEPVPLGTRVTVRHSGWAALRPDHPVRHGAEGAAFIRNMGMWWADLMTSLREQIAARDEFRRPQTPI